MLPILLEKLLECLSGMMNRELWSCHLIFNKCHLYAQYCYTRGFKVKADAMGSLILRKFRFIKYISP
jgi:hypothetical protein